MKKILNGSDLAGYIKERQARDVRRLNQAKSISPKLAIVLTKDDPVIDTYIRLKMQYGKDIGVEVIGVNDVNSELTNVAREAKLSTERLRMLECANAVIKNADTLRLELIEEAAGSAEAPEADFEV